MILDSDLLPIKPNAAGEAMTESGEDHEKPDLNGCCRLLCQRAMQDEASQVERGLLASWVRGASLARHLIIVTRVTMPGCWGPPRIVLLRARPCVSRANHWHKAALSELRGGRLSCVGWGRYELRRRNGDFIAAFRAEPPSPECLAFTSTSLERLREIERHCWGPWRRSRAPNLGQVCEARWGPIAPCPEEVLLEASRIAMVKAAQTCTLTRSRINSADASTVAEGDDNESVGPKGGEVGTDGNSRPLPLPMTLTGEPCNVEELRESAHQIAALAPVRPDNGWVCAICLGGSNEPQGDLEVKGCLAWRKLPCGHVFHKSCVLPWIRVGKPCPLGRCSVPAAARAGKREMRFLQSKSAWQLLPDDVVARDLLACGQEAPLRPRVVQAPPHLRTNRPMGRCPNQAFFQRLLEVGVPLQADDEG